MDIIAPVANIAFAISAYLATQRILQRHETTGTNEPMVPQRETSSSAKDCVRSCVICTTDEQEEDPLLQAPCGEHFICRDDVASFFQHAINDERLFPPKCCNKVLQLDDFEPHLPSAIASAYRTKAQGEYAVLPKHRIYCANPRCSQFLAPARHIHDAQSNTAYAQCTAEACTAVTCLRCKTLLRGSPTAHVCGAASTDEALFQRVAREKGYQVCFACGAVIELREACNHVRCKCRASLCYICGHAWSGPHACPLYGPPRYDAAGYNQDGFHRDTGRDREGRTRRDRMYRGGGGGGGGAGAVRGRRRRRPWIPAIPRIGITLAVLFVPGVPLVLRVGVALCVSLVPPVVALLPGGEMGHEYDWIDGWEDEVV